jgi:hypothetical protein
MPWTQWFGWTLLFAAIYWGVELSAALLEERLPGVAPWLRFLIPLLAAFLVGARLRSWWWVLGPPIAIIVIMLTYPVYSYLTSPQTSREQSGSGLILAIFLILINAGLALLAAAAGVIYAKTRFGG